VLAAHDRRRGTTYTERYIEGLRNEQQKQT
jgi:hypothetical protein